MLEFDRRFVLVPVLVGIALVVTAFFATEMGRERLISRVHAIQESQQRVRLLAEIQATMTDAESSQRGYVLTGDESYLEPYQSAKQLISVYTTEVQVGYSKYNRTDMHPRAAKLIELCSAKLTELDSTIVLYRQGPKQAMALVRTKLGQEMMDQLRGLIAEMRVIESKSVIEQTSEWLHIHTIQRILSIIGTSLNILLIVLAGYLVTKDIRRRNVVTGSLEDEVQKRGEELSELSTHLQRVSESEKSGLARELHDELGGLLVAIKMDLAQLRGKLDLAQPDIQKRWDRIQSALSSGIDLKRRVIEQLRPSLLDNMGLATAIRWQAGEICGAANLELVQSYPAEEPDISADGAIALFRVAQESLINIAKHARAKRVIIDLALLDGELMLMVEDDGVGLPASRAMGAVSHGMKSMRHRLLPFGGQFSVEQVEPTGLRIRVRVALSRISTHASHAP